MPLATPDLPQTQAAIIEMTNAFRAENRLAAVAPNATLQMAAKAFADYLARNNAFAHTADGRQPADRAGAAGYRFCMVAENIALNQTNRGFETRELAQRTVEGWKNSPPHRAAMLQPHVIEIGVGIAKSDDADPKYLTVQLFGRPESLKYQLNIENRSGTLIHYTLGDQHATIADQTRIRHTSCVPQEISFDVGKVTSKFEARDGAVFIIARGADNALQVSLQGPTASASASTSTASARPVKAVKSQR